MRHCLRVAYSFTKIFFFELSIVNGWAKIKVKVVVERCLSAESWRNQLNYNRHVLFQTE